MPRWVLIVPLVWAALGLSAATSLGMREDLGLVVAAVAAAALLLPRHGEGRPAGHPQTLAA